MRQTEELKNFWDELEKQAEIKFKDIEKLKDLLFKVLLKTEELERSRNAWKIKYDNKILNEDE